MKFGLTGNGTGAHAIPAFAVAMCMALVAANTATAGTASVIWQDGDQLVQLIGQDDTAGPPNDHPADFSADDVAGMLDALQIDYAAEGDERGPVSAFTRNEIEQLGPALAEGLRRASPREDLIFHVVGTRSLSPGAFAKRNRVSAGRVFVRDGRLNVIFGQVLTPYRKRNLYGQRDADFYPRNYGSRTEAARHEAVFLTGESVRLGGAKEARGDWLVIEPGARPARAANAGLAAVAPAAPVSAPVPAQAPPAGEPPPGPVPAAAPGDERSIEARLEELKRLRERGLVTEQAYESKMQEILEDL